MLYNIEPNELRIIPPLPNRNPLPEWGEPILKYVAPRIVVGVDIIIKRCFPSGNRTGRKKLVQLAMAGYLKRYEMSASARYFIAYSLGLEGVRLTKTVAPEVDMLKTQELIIANEFCHSNYVESFTLWPNRSLLIGEVVLNDHTYSLWCPRQIEKPRRIKSLQHELPLSSQGLIVVAPNLRLIYSFIEHMTGIYAPIYFCIDNILDRFMRMENRVLVPV